MAKGKLTAKQKKFVQEYLIDLNATQAAIRAGYSQKTASRIGPELLGKTCIVNAMQKAMKSREERTQVTQDRVLREYAKIAFADMKDYVSFRTEKVVIGIDDDGSPITDYRQIIDVKSSDEVDGTVIQEVSVNAKGVFTFKLHDKKGALDALGRHLGMFKDKLEVPGLNELLEALAGAAGSGDNDGR